MNTDNVLRFETEICSNPSSILESLEIPGEFLGQFISPHTRKAYKRDLLQFTSEFLPMYEIHSWKDVKKAHIEKFRDWLMLAGGKSETPCAPKTVNRKIASVRSLYSFFNENDDYEIDFNPALKVKLPPNLPLKKTPALGKEDLTRFLDAVRDNSKVPKLHYAILLTYFGTGLRVSEVIKVKMKNLFKVNGVPVIQIIGKGHKVIQKVLAPQVYEAILEYLSWMDSIGRARESEDYIFSPSLNQHDPKNLEKSINPRWIFEMFKKYAKVAGIDSSITPHSARTTFITELLDQGEDIVTVSEEAGHSTVEVTRMYDRRSKKLTQSLVLRQKLLENIS